MGVGRVPSERLVGYIGGGGDAQEEKEYRVIEILKSHNSDEMFKKSGWRLKIRDSRR